MGRSPQGDADQGAPEWTLGNDRCRRMPGAGTRQWQGNPREPWCRRPSLNQSSSSTVPVVVPYTYSTICSFLSVNGLLENGKHTPPTMDEIVFLRVLMNMSRKQNKHKSNVSISICLFRVT